jgi:type VII secretion protein EccB
MQTRRDRLQAYQYQLRRIMSALLGMEPESPEQPMRRVRTAMFSGVMVGALACGVVALIGWISHSSSRDWEKMELGLVQIKETGAQFIYFNKTLYPVANYTSAQLILGNDTIAQNKKTIPRANTTKAAPGQLVGINNIPPSLPDADSAANSVWNVCNHIETKDGQQRRRVDLYVGQSSPNTQFLDDNTLNVRDTVSGKIYVIYEGKRLLVDSEDTLRVLGLSNSPIVQVLPAWLNAIPEGTPLEPIAVPNAGTPGSPEIAGEQTVIGQVFDAQGEFFIMQRDGLVPISATQSMLLTGIGGARDPNGQQSEALEIRTADTVGKVSKAASPAPKDQPEDAPKPLPLPNSDPMLCLDYSSETPDKPLDVKVGGSLSDDVPRVEPAGGNAGGRLADGIALPGGQFSLMRSVAGSDPNQGNLFILTGDGLKYPVPSKDVLTLLGYANVDIWPVPRGIADMIDTGPALDPKVAKGPALASADAQAQPTESASTGN